MEDMNDMKREVKKTAKKAEYMAKEIGEDIKDGFEGAVNMMENKADEVVDMYEQKKFARRAEKKVEQEYKAPKDNMY